MERSDYLPLSPLSTKTYLQEVVLAKLNYYIYYEKTVFNGCFPAFIIKREGSASVGNL